jgi:hypothetical protein
MKNKKSTFLCLIGCALCATFASTVLANHRAGDFPLPEIMTAGDFNHDGNLDLAVNLLGFDNFAVLNGDGKGGFAITRQVEEDTLPKQIVSGDVDGDGQLDIVSVCQWGYNIKVYLGNGGGDFQFASELNGDGEPSRILLADLNKDGILDIVANAPTEGKLLIYFGLGNGRFANTALELETYPNLFALETGDFNKDGNVDIAITYFVDTSLTGTHLQILLGDGAGNFAPGQNVVINSQCNNVRAYDLNKDGNLDIILAGAGSENVNGVFVSTYLGDGKGNFTVKQVINLGTGRIEGLISLADFNEDGNIDIALPLASTANVLIFLGDGTGNFTQGQSITVGIEAGSTWAADFNKDGHIDLACTNRTDGTLSILLGNGDATFTTHATIPLNAPPSP